MDKWSFAKNLTKKNKTDVEDKIRIVWVFPVKSVYGESIPVPAKVILQSTEEKEEIAKTISDEIE